jgi:chloramphenicol-sensitive protein RarD
MAGLAVILQAVLAGGVPWVSLALAFSFAGYGYVRKVTPVKATPGLFVETVLLLPFAGGYLLLSLFRGVDTFASNDLPLLLALAGTGIITALPLICFSSAARRLPLFMLGLMQYIAPSLHFLMAIYIWGETLDQAKLMGFAMIWLALVVFTADSWRNVRKVSG